MVLGLGTVLKTTSLALRFADFCLVFGLEITTVLVKT